MGHKGEDDEVKPQLVLVGLINVCDRAKELKLLRPEKKIRGRARHRAAGQMLEAEDPGTLQEADSEGLALSTLRSSDSG